MPGSSYGTLLLLLIPGAVCYTLNSYIKPDYDTLQAYMHRADGSPRLPNLMLSLYQSFHRLESGHGVDLPHPEVQGVDLPHPEVHGVDLPHPAVHGVDLPHPAVHGVDLPHPRVHGVDLPHPEVHGYPSSPKADIIRSLAAKSINHMGGRYVLVFDFSSLSHDEELQFAEVRMRISALEKPLADGEQLIMDIFHHDSACQKPKELCKNSLYLGMLRGTLEYTVSDSYIVVDATAVVSRWFDISNNFGIHPEKRKERFSGTKSAKNRYKEHTFEDQPLLLFVFSNTSMKEGSLVTAILLQDATQSKYLKAMSAIKNITVFRRRRRSHVIKDCMVGINQVPPVDNQTNVCRRVDFIVDFKMIGWDRWIIHPKKYNAYRCEGTCPSPVNERVKPNNHSYLQSLVNLYNSRKAPEVCCVPTKMSSLSMAYYVHMDIAFQSHESMVVEECGCR